MPQAPNPYDVLGVPRDAGLKEIKLAYRKAALKCHPDQYEGDPREADRKLRELITAYKSFARTLEPEAWQPTGRRAAFTPQDFARYGYREVHEVDEDDPDPFGTVTIADGVPQPTRDEMATFLLLWAIAVVVGILVGAAALILYVRDKSLSDLPASELVLSVLFGELIYVALLVTAFFMVKLTRKVVRLTIQLAARRWRVLPTPVPEHTLPDTPRTETETPEENVRT